MRALPFTEPATGLYLLREPDVALLAHTAMPWGYFLEKDGQDY